MSQLEDTDTAPPFPCPICGQFFTNCVENTNHMGVVEANLLCPSGHAWMMRWVAPSWAAA